MYYNSMKYNDPKVTSFALGWISHDYSDSSFESESMGRYGQNLNTGKCLRFNIDVINFRRGYNPFSIDTNGRLFKTMKVFSDTG